MARTLGAWDCTYCDTKKNLGNVFDCPGCGHPRPKGVRFYQIPNAPLVTPEIAAQLGSGGPNWYCLHCDSGNKDNNTKCWNCGAERGSSPSHEVKDFRQGEAVPTNTEDAEKADPDGQSWVDEETDTPTSSFVPFVSTNYQSPSTSLFDRTLDQLKNNFEPKNVRPIAITSIVLIAVALVSFLVYQLFFNTHEEIVQVSGFSWSQTVTVQEYQVVHESSWTTHPSKAYNVSSVYKDTGRDEKIHDGWETVYYQDTCYETVSYTDTCTDSKYVSDTCSGSRDNGDGSWESYTYECGGYESYSYSCTKDRQESYSCTKDRQEEIYHYEDVYDWYFQYDIDKWMTVATYPTSGNNHEPYFYSDFTLTNSYDGQSAPQLGQQQQSQNLGEYTVTFKTDKLKVGDNGVFTRKYDLADWKLFSPEIGYPITVNAFNGIISYPVP